MMMMILETENFGLTQLDAPFYQILPSIEFLACDVEGG
jgi:hypothetical protein